MATVFVGVDREAVEALARSDTQRGLLSGRIPWGLSPTWASQGGLIERLVLAGYQLRWARGLHPVDRFARTLFVGRTGEEPPPEVPDVGVDEEEEA